MEDSSNYIINTLERTAVNTLLQSQTLVTRLIKKIVKNVVPSLPRPAAWVFMSSCVSRYQGQRREVCLTLWAHLFLGTVWHTGLCQGKARLEKTFPASTSDPLAPVNPSNSPLSPPRLASLQYP